MINTVGTRLLYITALLLLPLMAEEELDLSPLESALTARDEYGSVVSEVEQHKTLPSLAEPLITKGKLWLLPQKAFRWEQGTPVTDIAICMEEDVFLLNENEKTVEQHKEKDRQVRPLMLLMGMGEDSTFKGLLENFQAIETDLTEETFTVTFQPDSGTMKRAVSTLTLSIDIKSSFPISITWEQKDGAVITTTFISPKFNQAVSEELFLFNAEEYTEKE